MRLHSKLSSQTSAAHQAQEQHSRALAIARDIVAPLEEARAFEGLGQADLQAGNLAAGGMHLEQALTIYKRPGAPSSRRVGENVPTPPDNPTASH